MVENNITSNKSVVGLPIRREEATTILTECYGANLLELDEFERRAETVQQATSLEEINEVIFDLPEKFLKSLTEFKINENTTKPITNTESKSINRNSIAHTNKSNKVISIMSERRLTGNWLHNNEVTILSIMGSSRLDFRNVDFPDTDIMITTSVIMGEVIIDVSKDVKVVIEATPIMGNIKTSDNLISKTIKDHTKVLIIKGVVIMGEVRINVH
jgi:hypothetical protein